MFTLKQLQVLVKVAETGSLNGAAYELGYGMPTISHHLRALESECETSLIVRSTRGTRLTDAGMVVLREAKIMLARAAALEEQVAQMKETNTIPFRIGTFASIGSKLVPHTMREMSKKWRVRVELTEGESSEVVEMLLKGKIDVGLIYDYDADPLQIDSTKIYASELFHEPFEVLVGIESPWYHEKELDFTKLKDERWIMSRKQDEASDRLLHRVCAQHGYTPRTLVQTDDLTMIHGLVRSGQSLALSTRAAFDGFNGVRLTATKQNIGNRRVWFIRNQEDTIPQAQECENIMREFVSNWKWNHGAK